MNVFLIVHFIKTLKQIYDFDKNKLIFQYYIYCVSISKQSSSRY